MKKSLLLLTLGLASHGFLSAQTNTFPTTGNVGIGTTSPGYPLTLFGGGLLGYNSTTADAKVNFGKPPLLQLTGDGSVNNGPGLALFQINIGAADVLQSAAELSLAATRGATAGTRQAVQNTDLLGSISWFGDDGTTVRTRGATIQSNVDTSSAAVSSQIIPTRLSIGTIAATPIIFYTNAGNGISGAYNGGGWQLSTSPNERMRITGGGDVGIGIASPIKKLDIVGSGNAGIRIADAAEIAGGGLFVQQNSDLSGRIDMPGRDLLVTAGWNKTITIGNLEFTTNGGKIIFPGGNVGIGTTNPTQKLSVNGTIRAKEVIVDTGWSDYVFAPDYKLAPLSEVESHIKQNGHLPGIPSAKEVSGHGVSMGEMQAKLLAKIEELTLHQIEQEKQVKIQAQHQREQDERIQNLEAENRVLRIR